MNIVLTATEHFVLTQRLYLSLNQETIMIIVIVVSSIVVGGGG
jgi:hypothetical protein